MLKHFNINDDSAHNVSAYNLNVHCYKFLFKWSILCLRISTYPNVIKFCLKKFFFFDCSVNQDHGENKRQDVVKSLRIQSEISGVEWCNGQDAWALKTKESDY